MTQKKGLLIEIGVSIAVLMVATVALGTIYNRNIEEGTELPWTDIEVNTFITDINLQNNVIAFSNPDEFEIIFPNTPLATQDIDWDTQLLLAYIGNPTPVMDYSYEIIGSHIQGTVATLKYRFSFSDANNPFPLEPNAKQNHPVLFVALSRSNIDTTNQFTFRFQNADTNETHSLTTFLSNEDTTNN